MSSDQSFESEVRLGVERSSFGGRAYRIAQLERRSKDGWSDLYASKPTAIMKRWRIKNPRRIERNEGYTVSSVFAWNIKGKTNTATACEAIAVFIQLIRLSASYLVTSRRSA